MMLKLLRSSNKRTQGNEGAGEGMSITRDVGLEFNANSNNLRVEGDIIAFYSSDERLKDNISRIEDPLAKLSQSVAIHLIE